MECAEAKGMGNLGDLMKSFDEPSETAKKAEEMVHPMHHPRPMKVSSNCNKHLNSFLTKL